ncbi:ABC transporter permease subunit [Cryobacterium glaciale]|uniref:ABC transporter permease subunit n=1 Tax=Cryobacterium glaciale TaxID=1259145 RepID=A0A4R8UUH8_9MICO|nr:ABC transporter permease subunit [Cryobacterium glaciale]TFB72118.1 ABC transporter permease subunit [Cryobacterium glaciale]
MLGLRAGIVALILLAWEVAPRVVGIPKAFIVPLSSSIEVGVREWGRIGPSLWPTISAMIIGIAVTWALGIALGFIIGTSRSLALLTRPLGMLYAIPFVIVYPLLSVWLGPGQFTKIVFAIVYGLIPVILTTASGVRSADERLVRAAVSMGATRGQLVQKVLLPGSLPIVMSGLRLGGGLVIIAVIVSEMLASTSGGIGTLITSYRVSLNAGAVYFCILLVLIIALVMDQSIVAVERWVRRGEGQRSATSLSDEMTVSGVAAIVPDIPTSTRIGAL